MRYRYSFTIWILILVGNILSGISSWAKSPIEFNAGFFAKALEQGLEHSMTVKHNCRNRDSRKELTLLAAVLVPPGWLIRLKEELLLVNP